MKRNSVMSIVGGLILLSSCHDLDLNPLAKGSTETWYSTETEITMAVNDLYRVTFWQQDGEYQSDWSDDYTYREALTAFENATLNGQNDNVTKLWANQYKAIARANSVILKADRAIENGVSEETVNQLVGEARFHRGCAYSKLVSKFGDVPLVKEELDIDQGLAMGRTDKNTVLKFIYDDFDAAAAVLPATYPGMQRATKGAALSFKARIALYMADWATAAEAAKAVMDLNIYKLHTDYSDLFLVGTKKSDELIFVIPRSVEYADYYLDDGTVRNDLIRNAGGWAATDPSWDLLAAYTCDDGLPIDESPRFDSHDPFKNRDPRCCMTIVPFGENVLGYEYSPHPEAVTVMNYATGKEVTNNDSRVNAQYASFNGLVWKKGIDKTWTENGFRVAQDMIVCRYAEVLLIYAEAKIELNQIEQSVLDAMNSVRARAYGVDPSAADRYPAFKMTDQAKLRYELRVERRMEFAKEHMRYMDMMRWKQAEIVMKRKGYGIIYPASLCVEKVTSVGDWFWPFAPEIDENGLPDFTKLEQTGKIAVLTQRLWDNRQYLWPIPTNEILINGNMKQNSGY